MFGCGGYFWCAGKTLPDGSEKRLISGLYLSDGAPCPMRLGNVFANREGSFKLRYGMVT
jgi:hypothetical protein